MTEGVSSGKRHVGEVVTKNKSGRLPAGITRALGLKYDRVVEKQAGHSRGTEKAGKKEEKVHG